MGAGGIFGHAVPVRDAVARAVTASARHWAGAPERAAGAARLAEHELGDRQRLEDRCRDAEAAARFRDGLLGAVGQAVIGLDLDGRVIYLNRPAETMYGWLAGDVLGRPAREVFRSDLDPDEVGGLLESIRAGGSWLGDVTARRQDGSTFPALVSATPYYEGGRVEAIIAVSVDVSERKAFAEALARHALHDPLTDLPNRRAVVADLDRRLASQRDEVVAALVALVDVDEFKVVNEALGHPAGDDLLLMGANALRHEAHAGDVVGRFAGDTFAVCCFHGLDGERARAYADRLRGALGRGVTLHGYELEVRASAGIVVSESAALTADELLQRAETALSRAKDEGRNQTWVYDAALRERLLRRLHVEALVRTIVARGEVDLAYLPTVRLNDQTVIGAEALLRIVDEGGVPVPAAELVAAAESSGQMRALGQIVLRTACREAARWKQAVPERPLTVAVNLAGAQLADPQLPADVTAALELAGLEPSRLCLDIAESVLMEDSVRSARQLAQLNMRGVRLSADDFGTGYSSLAYLKRLPLDSIKADRSFVAGLPDNPEDVSIVSAMMGVASALGLNVVAEGVENPRQLGGLLQLGCAYAQGHLWSRAVSGDELLELVAAGDMAVEPVAVTLPAEIEAKRMPDQGSPDDEALNSAFHTLAHEIRTPLTVVMGYASLLEQAPDPESAEYATSIRKASERIRRLILNLEEARSVDAGTIVLERTPVSVLPMLERVLDDLRGVIGAPIALDVRSGTDAISLLDETSIEQILVNLVVNAAKFGPPDRAPDVVLEERDGWIEISVLDDGPGVAQDQLGLIFRKYGRIDHSVPGTGLGLYLARGTARAHGGEILYRRRHADHGSVFTLRLPGAME